MLKRLLACVREYKLPTVLTLLFILGEAVIETLRPIQERFTELMKEKDYLTKCYTEGAQKALYLSNKTLRKVMKKIGFIPKEF